MSKTGTLKGFEWLKGTGDAPSAKGKREGNWNGSAGWAYRMRTFGWFMDTEKMKADAYE